MSDEPGAGDLRELLARLRAVVEAKDSENAVLRAELSAALDRERRLELRIAELERRLGMDSSNSGTPGSKEPIGAQRAPQGRAPGPEYLGAGAAQGPQARRAARAPRRGPVPGP